MESIISTFHIDWKIIIAQAINFGVVFAILYVFALKPLSKLMTERSERIAKGVQDAKENATLVEKTRAGYELALEKARAEADKIFEAGKKEAEQKRHDMLLAAQQEVTTTIENGRKTLEAEKAKILQEAKIEIAALALKATEKLLGKNVDNSFDAKTAEELSEL